MDKPSGALTDLSESYLDILPAALGQTVTCPSTISIISNSHTYVVNTANQPRAIMSNSRTKFYTPKETDLKRYGGCFDLQEGITYLDEHPRNAWYWT